MTDTLGSAEGNLDGQKKRLARGGLNHTPHISKSPLCVCVTLRATFTHVFYCFKAFVSLTSVQTHK